MEVRTVTSIEVIGELSFYELTLNYYGLDLMKFEEDVKEAVGMYWEEETEEAASMTLIEYVVQNLSVKFYELKNDYDVYVVWNNEEDEEWDWLW